MGLELRDVGRTFDGKAAVKNVSFKARQGEVIGLLGTSGCGKSTLLRALSGLDGAYEGDIFINGQPANGIGGTTGFIFQRSEERRVGKEGRERWVRGSERRRRTDDRRRRE